MISVVGSAEKDEHGRSGYAWMSFAERGRGGIIALRGAGRRELAGTSHVTH